MRADAAASRYTRLGAVLLALGLSLAAPGAGADAFDSAHYDPVTDSLVVTLLYSGTNPDHQFTLRWVTCSKPDANGVSEIAAEVLDSQWDDAAQQDFTKTVRFSLAALPCRPAEVTLRTPPRFIYTVYVPGKKADS
jgi:hypothetical protein